MGCCAVWPVTAVIALHAQRRGEQMVKLWLSLSLSLCVCLCVCICGCVYVTCSDGERVRREDPCGADCG